MSLRLGSALQKTGKITCSFLLAWKLRVRKRDPPLAVLYLAVVFAPCFLPPSSCLAGGAIDTNRQESINGAAADGKHGGLSRRKKQQRKYRGK